MIRREKEKMTGFGTYDLINSGSKSIFILLGFILLTAMNSIGQRIIPDTTVILIGSQTKLTLELESLKGTLVEWPQFGDTITGSVEIISKEIPDTTFSKDNRNQIIRQILTITSFDTGFIVIPPVTFRIKDKSGSLAELKSDPVMLEVKNVQVDAAKDIKDIKPLQTAPYTLRDFLPWILLVLALAFLITLAWFYFRNRRKNKPLIKLPVRHQKPPDVIALELLENLRKEQVWQKGQIKEYYTRLTDILRGYFESRFGVNAAEMTSDEILSAMKDHLTEISNLSDLRKLLTLSDLAKFAKGQPLGAENELSLTYAKTIILNTALSRTVEEEKAEFSNTTVNQKPESE